MQNKFIDKINVSSKIIILFMIACIIFIAKSIYLLSFITILLLILMLLTNKNVKFYVETFKNMIFILLFAVIVYIIVTRNIIGSFVFLYKIILIILFGKQLFMFTKFHELSNGIYTLIRPLKKLNTINISYNICLYIFFISIYLNSKKEIFKNYVSEKKFIYTFSIKYNIFPRLFLTISKVKNIENSLKIKNYKMDYEYKNKESVISIFCFIALLVIVFFKEVVM